MGQWRWDAVGSSVAGAVVGGLGACILTGDTVTAEVGQELWLVIILSAGAAVASPRLESVRLAALFSLPFLGSLLAILWWTGAAPMAYSVAYAIVVKHINIPLAAFTQREMTIRNGLFFLFVLVASPPGILASVLAFRNLGGLAVSVVGGRLPGPLTPGAWIMILSLWRSAVCFCMFALARIV